MHSTLKFHLITPTLLLMLAVAGCTGTPRWGAGSRHPTTAQIAAMLGQPDSYVYFPRYEVYYNRTSERYVFRHGGAWVIQSEAPAEVGEDALRDSPSVLMNFDDAPARHHAVVVRAYPRGWGRAEAAMASANWPIGR